MLPRLTLNYWAQALLPQPAGYRARSMYHCGHHFHLHPSRILESIWVHGRKTSLFITPKSTFQHCHLSDYRASTGVPEEAESTWLSLSWRLSPSPNSSSLLSRELQDLPALRPSGTNWNLCPSSKLFQNKSDFPSPDYQLFPTAHSSVREENHDQGVHLVSLGRGTVPRERGTRRSELASAKAPPTEI